MKTNIDKLNLLAILASIISFLWIGLQDFIFRFKSDRTFELVDVLTTIFPYLIFIISFLVIIWTFQKPKVEYHSINSISSFGNNSDKVHFAPNDYSIELFSSEDHMKVEIAGSLYGPELNNIKKYFGGEIRVYSIVQEYSRPNSYNLLWVQSNESGILDERGYYKCQAYLGGQRISDNAKNDEVFVIYTCVPDKKTKFDTYSVYEEKNLPRMIYLSNPLYVKVKRV